VQFLWANLADMRRNTQDGQNHQARLTGRRPLPVKARRNESHGEKGAERMRAHESALLDIDSGCFLNAVERRINKV
jgi:hypothetical protein